MSLLVGIDDVGLGPVAGPVVAAAVLIEDGAVPGVRDSKKVPEGQRYALAEEIRRWGLCPIHRIIPAKHAAGL